MSLTAISRSHDLSRLRDEGFEIEVRAGHLLLHHVPYVNAARQVLLGTLVSALDLAGDVAQPPSTHVLFFAGEYPCDIHGKPIEALRHTSGRQRLADIDVDHSFSNKPPGGYRDYYEKMTRYVDVLSAPARSLSPQATATTFARVEAGEDGSPFVYADTNTSRAKLGAVSKKLEGQRIALVGLGGTGTYVLDALAKTPVREIHLFDGDRFVSHSAFRAPGAAPIEELRKAPFKTDYFQSVYSHLHTGVYSHAYFMDEAHSAELDDLSFVFFCVDRSQMKKDLFDRLHARGIPFVDVGMGLETVGDQLIGMLRVTASSATKHSHIEARVTRSETVDEAYQSNIQIAELNMLNAALAVIKWKKMFGFYQDLTREHSSTYCLNVNTLASDDCAT